MKHFLAKIFIGLALVMAPFSVQAARTDALWDYIQGGNYTKPNGSPSGTNLLIYGSDKYVNFGVVTGTNGYGFRDNSGTIQWKNSGGSWQNIGTGGTGGAQTPWTSDIDGAGFTLSNAYLTATATTLDLSGVTNSLVYANGIGRLGAIATTSLGLPTFSDISSYLSLSSWYATTTDGLDEGVTNLYYTNPRVLTYLDTLSKGYFWSTTSADVWDGTKSRWSTTSSDYWLTTKTFSSFSTTSADYWDSTKSRWSTTSNNYWLTQQTTDGLAQGSTNKYFANSLVDTWLGTKNLGVFWSTTSADAWHLTKEDVSFSTTSADYWVSLFDKGYFFSTTSADHWLTTQSITSASSTLYGDNGTFSGLNTFADISFTNATGSNVTSSVFCLIGDTCISAWPTSGGGSGIGTIATSSAETANEIPFYTSTNGYPSLLGTNSDFTYAPAPSSILSVPNITIGSEIRGNSWRDISGVTGFDVDTLNVNATIGSGGYFTIKDNVTALQGSISLSGISANHTYYLPDIDGTLVTDGVISTLVPYSGAGGNLDMGTWNVTTPQINSVDTPLLLLGSDSATLDTPGNTVTVRGGKGNGTGDGAYAYVVGGDSGDTEGIGGGVGLIGGYSYGASHGGNIELSVGGSATGDNGKFIFNQNVVGGALGVLDFSLLGTSEKTFQFPNQSGTLALLSDIGGAGASSTLLADDNTFSGVNVFNNKVGIGTSSPFATLSIVGDTPPPELVIAKTSGGVPLFQVNAKTSSHIPLDNALVGIDYDESKRGAMLDPLNVARINSGEWNFEQCSAPEAETTQITADTTRACGRYSYIEDTNGVINFASVNRGISFGLKPGATGVTTVAGDGMGIGFLGGNGAMDLFASGTPVFEAVAKIDTTNATSSIFMLGIANKTTMSADFASVPTLGAFFVASTSANYFAQCRTSGGGTYYQDTGVATTSVIGGVDANFKKFRIEATSSSPLASGVMGAIFYIQNGPNNPMVEVARCTNIAQSVNSNIAPVVSVGKTSAGLSPTLFVSSIRYWWKTPM